MKALTCELEGILLLEPSVFRDDRGCFIESYQKERYEKLGITEDFLQDNYSRSKKNVLRGLHFTRRKPQAQILTILSGSIFDVVVDIRDKSLTFGRWFGIELSSNKAIRQIFMPHGFAHGFCVLSDYAELHYKVSQQYDPNDEAGLLWNDLDLGIIWPIHDPKISEKDKNNLTLHALTNLKSNGKL